MFYEAVSTVVQIELSREVISSLPWQYTIEAITHSKCRRFICLSHCRKTAVSMDTTLERWWAKTGTLPSSSPAPTLMVHPTLFHPKCQPSPFGQGGNCFWFLSVAPPQPHTTPWSWSVLSSSPAEGTETFLQTLGKQEGHQVTQTLLSATSEAFMLCYFYILPRQLTARGA